VTVGEYAMIAAGAEGMMDSKEQSPGGDARPDAPPASGGYFDREYFTFHSGKRKYFNTIVEIILRRLPRSGGRVLDVGSGYGFLLSLFEERGFETYGIELSPEAAERSRSYCRAPISIQSAETAFPYADGFFDAIVMNDVIEHLRNYRLCLSEAFRTLAPDGLVFVQTLNGHSIARALLGKGWTWYKDPTHVHIFTPKLLKTALREQGFDLLRTRTFFNFCQVGETTKFLKPFRRIARIVPVPFCGDSAYVLARKP